MAEQRKRICGLGALFACLFLMVAAVPTASAAAGFGIGSFTTTASTQQAGAHADISSSFALKTDALGNPIGGMKNVRIEMPEGLIGNPQVAEKCAYRSLMTAACQAGSQVGTFELSFVACRGFSTSLIAPAEVGATELQMKSTVGVCEEEQVDNNLITIGSGPNAEQVRISALLTSHTIELSTPIQHEHAAGESVTHIARPVEGPLPLFNLKPFPGHIATLGTYLLGITILVQIDISPQNRLVATVEDVSSMLPLAGGGVTLWGVPGDASHNALRCSEFSGCGLAAPAAEPFLSLPSECSNGPMTTLLTVESWHGESETGESEEPAPTGCERLSIEPTLKVRPETTEADVPSGYEVELKVPQHSEPYVLATPALKDIAVTLPAGTSLSPAFAAGLGTCAETQSPCPDDSRMGTVEIVSPALSAPLKGSVFFGTPTAEAKYPMLVRASGPGLSIQFNGRAVPDPTTGQVTATFEHAPELPFSELRFSFFGGNVAALDNPQPCGPAASSAAITAYGGSTAAPASSFDVEGNCQGSFSPGFLAGTKVPKAAAYSPFSFTLTRADGETDLSSFTAELPPGLLGLLGSITECGEPQAASGDCPQGSAVGTATVGVGSGPSPLSISGPVYLTGPYGNAPFGLDVMVHAAAGPIDLGNVLVRSHMYVDEKTLALKIASDPLPQILDGIPLRIRSIHIELDRPDFVVNPSSCRSTAITGTAVSTSGASHPLSTPFGVLGCHGLRFAPHLGAAAGPVAGSGKGVGLELHIAAGGATSPSLGKVTLTLPHEFSSRLSAIQHACVPAGAPLEVACGAASRVGTASIVTPALAQPLTGNAYLVGHGSSKLPTLVLLLHSGPITQELEGTLRISKSHVLTTTFTSLPDVPMNGMTLDLPRGPHSLLTTAGSLCGRPLKINYAMTDQSGAAARSSSRVAVKGCGRKQ